ncbi:MAG: DUF1080 domain-containing protein, partial [Opitutales bacterium]|nr:DUF1080 domain-containing protein [Opitutales bacterium]
INPTAKDKLEDFYETAGDYYLKREWNRYRTKCVDDHIQIWVNGHKTTDVHDRSYQEGRVSIQHHGKGDTRYFRKIKIV